MNMTEVITNVVLRKQCSIKPDKDSAESKMVTLEVDYTGVTLQGVFNKSLSAAVIQWQNGPGRKQFDTWKHGQVVKISFKAPGQTAIDPLDGLIAEARAAGYEDVEAYLRFRLTNR